MADLAIVYRPDGTSIDALRLDAALRETHTHEAEATEHPVEKGANITDHIRQKPDGLTIEGVFTNTQLSEDGVTRAIETGGVIFETTVLADEESRAGAVGYAEACYRKLVEAKEAGKLVSVVTGLRSYDNMAITSITVPRDATIGDAVQFTIVLKQIIIVSTRLTKVDVREPKPKGKTKLGRQAAGAASEPTKTKAKSLLLQADEGLAGGAVERFLSPN
jgi:hypothetical protein